MYQTKYSKINLFSDERLEVEKFLSKFDLALDRDVEYTLVAKSDGEIVGTCSFSGKIIKSFAVEKDTQGQGIAAQLISDIRNTMFDKGIFETFIFTKPSNKYLFEGFGYHEVYGTDDVILMESISNNVEKQIKLIYEKSGLGPEKKAAMVMNCNPFTLGHKYIIEQASLENETLVVFIVEEDRSVFPFNIRLNLVKEGVKHLNNVHILPGGDYIISSNTFPSYFIKEDSLRDKAFKELDAGIFAKYIGPVFNFNVRYVGTEPFCPVTREYNQALGKILPSYGLELKTLERLIINDIPVSASAVRKHLKEDKWSEIENLVPETTFEFLKSEKAKEIIEKIKGSDTRH